MQFLNNLFRDQGGQTATEYMVLLASVVAAILGAAYLFTGDDGFKGGVIELGKHVKKNLSDGFQE